MLNTIENHNVAKQVMLDIERDLLSGNFDPTLAKYKQKSKADNSIVEKYEQWCSDVRNTNVHNTTYYRGVHRMLKNWIPFEYQDIPALLRSENLGPATYNDRLNILKSFFDYLVRIHFVKSNPLTDVARKKRAGKKHWVDTKRTPLSSIDIGRIFEAIRTNEFCHPSSAYKHSHYFPFISFVFTTGVRNAEAIGLRVAAIKTDYVEIKEVMARTMQGTHSAARERKLTKTEEIRRIPLTGELAATLRTLIKGKKPDDLVFQSPKGNPIDDRMLQRRVLKPVLEKLGISPRDLYAARHSFGTRAIAQGMPATQVAYLMGHASVETTFRNYVSVQSAPQSLPSLF